MTESHFSKDCRRVVCLWISMFVYINMKWITEIFLNHLSTVSCYSLFQKLDLSFTNCFLLSVKKAEVCRPTSTTFSTRGLCSTTLWGPLMLLLKICWLTDWASRKTTTSVWARTSPDKIWSSKTTVSRGCLYINALFTQNCSQILLPFSVTRNENRTQRETRWQTDSSVNPNACYQSKADT